MVLIHSTLAHQLGLQPILLDTPEFINIAISEKKRPPSITHYMDIAPTTLSRNFQSRPLHAVMVDNLSVPLILGLPFLVTNSVSCNYAHRECNVRCHDHTINLLEQTPPEFPVGDILASIHKHASDTEDDSILTRLEDEMHERFKCIFEPLPHTDELPHEPVA